MLVDQKTRSSILFQNTWLSLWNTQPSFRNTHCLVFLLFPSSIRISHLRCSSACNFVKKETLAQVFSFEFCEIFECAVMQKTRFANWKSIDKWSLTWLKSILKISHSNYLWFCNSLPAKLAIFLKSSLFLNSFYCYKQNYDSIL